jgi:hypothetical protein
MKKQLLLSLIICLFFNYTFAQENISISDESSHSADPSAVLDVYSTTKGVLVPRLSSSNIALISNPAEGLLVYNTDVNSFYFYDGTMWIDLSSSGSSIWSLNSGNGAVYLNESYSMVGIGTDDPMSRLSVMAGTGANPDDALFEIKDEHGEPIFRVTSEGVRVFIKDFNKGVSGGFAVGKYGAAKDVPDTAYLIITPDSTRVYAEETEKGVAGGFAVGKYGAAKGTAENFLYLTENNYLIGHRAGDSLTTGLYNLFLGYEAGISDMTGGSNIFLGYQSGYSNKSGDANIFIGNEAGTSNVDGSFNTFMGDMAGQSISSGLYNTFIGSQSGQMANAGSYNVFLGHNAGRDHNLGDENVYIGFESGYGFTVAEDNNGARNVYIGYQCGYYNTTGNDNVYIGNESGFENTTGFQNVYIGSGAGKDNTEGMTNVAIGRLAGSNNISGDGNVFLGVASGVGIRTANENVCIGKSTGFFTDGPYNTMIGSRAGYNNEGERNVFIGNRAGYDDEYGSHRLYIENSQADSTNALIFGRFDDNHVRLNAYTAINGNINETYQLAVYGDAWSSTGVWTGSDKNGRKIFKHWTTA